VSETPFAVLEGPGGTRVEVFDLTSPYAYTNVFWVRLKFVATFAGAAEGSTFERMVERLGVNEIDLDRTRDEMIAAFSQTCLPYLFREDFCAKMEAAKQAKVPKASGYGK
jgi:hypothetical protein